MILSGPMRMRLRLLLSVVCVVGTVAATPRAQQAPSPALLWTVSDGAGSTAYLLGSIHTLTPDVYPLPEAMDQAFATSKMLVEEIDLDEASDPALAMKMLTKAMLPQGRTLEDLLPASRYAEVTDIAGGLGLPMPTLRQLQPWMAAILLSTATLGKAGYDPEKGIDRYFFTKAKAAGMPVRALETVDYQIERFSGLEMNDQIGLLEQMVSEASTMVREVRTLVERWRAGDADGLASLLRPSMDATPGLEERLLIERNRNWVPHIERCVREKQGCLVVVGAGHLVGRDSVVALLRARGLTVTQHGVPTPAPAIR